MEDDDDIISLEPNYSPHYIQIAYKFYKQKRFGNFNLIVTNSQGSTIHHYRDFIIDNKYQNQVFQYTQIHDPLLGVLVFTYPLGKVLQDIQKYEYSIIEYVFDKLEKNQIFIISEQYEYISKMQLKRRVKKDESYKKKLEKINTGITDELDKIRVQCAAFDGDEYVIVENNKLKQS